MRFIYTNKRIRDEKKSPLNILAILLLIVLCAYVLSLLGLLFWSFITSSKSYNDFRSSPYKFPTEFHFTDNFLKIWDGMRLSIENSKGVMQWFYIEDFFKYSLLYALGSAFTATLIPCITAYACARFPFKFSKVIYTVVIVTMIIPLVGTLPAELHMAKETLHIYNKIYCLWIMKANFLGMYFLVFYNVFKALPMSFTEAAKIDGASNLAILVRIVFPLIANTFATVMLINFINFWNDYQTPLMYMPSFPTVARALYGIIAGSIEANLQRPTYKMMSVMIVCVPILVVFLVFQKRLLGNLTVGGVKG